MAKMLQGILGAVSGKVGGVVAASWKDRIYVRGYSVPANPNTAAQQAQRGKFALCVNFAKLLIGQVFNVYTDKFLKSMSGFNYFISRNIRHFGALVNYAAILVTEGKLYMGSVINVTADAGTDTVTVNFNTDLGNNGDISDMVYGCCYNETKNLMSFLPVEESRQVGTVEFDIDLTAGDKVHVWIWATRYSGAIVELISNSVYGTATA